MRIKTDERKILLYNEWSELPTVKGLPDVKFSRKGKYWEMPLTAENLRRVGKLWTLPDDAVAELARLEDRQRRMDAERLNPEPTPMYDYPVKAKLYKHQIRAANMAMIAFGLDG